MDTFSNFDQQHHHTLEAIHDGAVDAIITINQQGFIETVNPATLALFGYEEGELVGLNISQLMPAPYRDEHDGYLKNYLATGIRQIIGIGREVVGKRKNGTQFPIHLAVSEIKLLDRRVFAGFVRDLTATKQIEAQLQSKLLISERLAAIGQTVSGMAHESRNAFQRSHACLAELALDLEHMPASLALVNKVQKALDDLHLMLEEVRCYAAPIILERRSCSLEPLVREVWQNMLDAKVSNLAPQFSIDVQADFPHSCLLDRDRIKRVIRNLLENAWFAGHEPKMIQVGLSWEQRPSSAAPILRLEVSDNGGGIAEADLETVFLPFYTTKTKGTGLGLALSRRYVEAHDGRIYVTAGERGGARFVVELPFYQKTSAQIPVVKTPSG